MGGKDGTLLLHYVTFRALPITVTVCSNRNEASWSWYNPSEMPVRGTRHCHYTAGQRQMDWCFNHFIYLTLMEFV